MSDPDLSDLETFDGTFNLPVNAERTWGSLGNFLEQVEDTLKDLTPMDRAAYDNEVAEYTAMMREVGMDPHDPSVVHAFAWGTYFLFLLERMMLQQHGCEDGDHVWSHMLPAAVRAGALIQAMRKEAGV